MYIFLFMLGFISPVFIWLILTNYPDCCHLVSSTWASLPHLLPHVYKRCFHFTSPCMCGIRPFFFFLFCFVLMSVSHWVWSASSVFSFGQQHGETQNFCCFSLPLYTLWKGKVTITADGLCLIFYNPLMSLNNKGWHHATQHLPTLTPKTTETCPPNCCINTNAFPRTLTKWLEQPFFWSDSHFLFHYINCCFLLCGLACTYPATQKASSTAPPFSLGPHLTRQGWKLLTVLRSTKLCSEVIIWTAILALSFPLLLPLQLSMSSFMQKWP